MKNNKMYLIYLNAVGKIESNENIESCTLNEFARDYFIDGTSNNTEIDETRNGNVYIKYINSVNDKVFSVHLYVLNTIKMDELIEDICEIRTELKYRNEEE